MVITLHASGRCPLNGDMGLGIFAASSPASQRIDRATGDPGPAQDEHTLATVLVVAVIQVNRGENPL